MQKSRVEIIIGSSYIIINDLDTNGKTIAEIEAKTATMLKMEQQFCSPCG